MKGNVKFLLIALWIMSMQAIAQEASRKNFIGLNPGITVEPFYESGEYDVNIVPLVYQRSISNRLELRFISLVNYGVRNEGNTMTHLGLEMALPVFFKKRDENNLAPRGFYLSPVVSLSRNGAEGHNNLGLWLEPGYHLLFKDYFAISFGLQVGTTYFMYDSGENKFDGHTGAKIVLGKWF